MFVSDRFGFYEMVVVCALLGVISKIVTTVVNRVAENASKKREEKTALERDYLRQMLLELEEIKRTLASRDDLVPR